MKQAILREDGTDIHELPCECGLCNTNGKSYGIGIYVIPEGTTLNSEDEVDDFLMNAEADYRTFGVSEDSAYEMAKALCSHEGIVIFELETETLHGIEVVNRVNFKIETDTLLSYEFETKKGIYAIESEDTFTTFRLDFFKCNGNIETYVANPDDYDITEDVSYLFDEQALLAYFQGMENAGFEFQDNTTDYLEHCE